MKTKKERIREWFARGPVSAMYLLVIVPLAATSIILAVLLGIIALAPPRAVQLEGTGSPRVVQVGLIPDTLARDFAVDFLVSFENYSPDTVDSSAAFSRSRVAPGVLPAFTKVLDNRRNLVRESGMVSQILIEDRAKSRVIRSEEDPTIEVLVTAHRMIYIAGRLTESARMVYRVR